jgi:hypothetical protein
MGSLRKPGNVSRRKRISVAGRKATIQVVLSIVALLAFGLATFYMRRSAGLLPWQRVPLYYDSVEQAKPFPKTLQPSAFRDPKVAGAYEIANRIPEILVQQPSYCLLAQRHHHSLLDCFRTNDAAYCGQICLKEAYLTDELNRAGKSAAEIRSLIIAGEWRSVKLE